MIVSLLKFGDIYLGLVARFECSMMISELECCLNMFNRVIIKELGILVYC